MSLSKQCLTGLKSNMTCIIGSQWGDEGKGKLVDILASKYDYCVRFNGGSNAGHTIIANGIKYPLHLLPCGILYESCVNVLGNGVVVNVATMFDELKQLDRDNICYKDRLFISDRAHLVTKMQIAADVKHESDPTKRFMGTTKQGIGPTYAAKANRLGLRIGDLQNWDTFLPKYNYMRSWFQEFLNVEYDFDAELEEFKELRRRLVDGNMITDTVAQIHYALQANKRVLAEGANACMLDIDFGTYPYVTSSSTNVGGVCTGIGIPPSKVGTVIGIAKAYCTRVGEGPFPTEQDNAVGTDLQKIGHEVGTTTGRKRRCGWIDIPALRYANMINGFSSINLTKLDVLDTFDEVQIGAQYTLNGKQINHMPGNIEEYANVKVDYITLPGWKQDITKIENWDDLPQNAKVYISKIEQLLGVPVSWVGNGPEREAMILNNTI